jgi:hypothetical protein
LYAAGVDADPEAPWPPDIDESGVDREQIRAMLRLTPEERLRLVEGFVEAILDLRERHAARPVR